MICRLSSALIAALLFASTTTAEPLKFTASKDDNYTESATFIADLEGGTYALVQLSVTNIGPGKENAVCRVLVAAPSSAPVHASERFGAGDWSYTGGATPRLKVGGCSVEATAKDTTVRAVVKGIAIVFTYSAPPSEKAPPDNVIALGGSRHVTTVLHAATPITATITLPKTATVTLRGTGYGDHSRNEVKPSLLAKRWIRFRALAGAQKVLMLGRETSEGAFGPLWLWQLPAEPARLARFVLTKKGDKKRPSFEVELTAQDNKAVRIRSNGFLFRHAPVEELGLLGKIVKPVVGSPVTYTTRATMELSDGRQVDGILEVSVDAE